MDIDQRFDRLTDRHEALTQSVELFIASTRESWNRFERVSEENDKRLTARAWRSSPAGWRISWIL